MSRYEQAIDVLMQGDRHRVWSLVVTIFGDLAQNKGDEIAAQTLGRLTEQFGIKAEALRVALHRLRKDGWLESKRLGRSSTYFLTDFGLEQSALATPRIYGLTDPKISDWVLLTTSNASESREGDATKINKDGRVVRIGAQIYLSEKRNCPFSSNTLVTNFDNSPVPDWVRDQIIDAKLMSGYGDLRQQLQNVASTIPLQASPIERAALRTLIVHSWRRILLRHADIPKGFYPQSCKAVECREIVLRLLADLRRPELSELSDH